MRTSVVSSLVLPVLALMSPALRAQPGAMFHVELSPQAAKAAGVEPADAKGRLVVFIIGPGSKLAAGTDPIDGPFWDDPQPLFGVDVASFAQPATVDDRATSFPIAPGALKPGDYVAQARFDRFRADSDWKREPGNLFSAPVKFTIAQGARADVKLTLTEVVKPDTRQRQAEVVSVESKLVSDFHSGQGKPVTLRAAVSKPLNYDPTRKYPAVYVVPGFGGNHLSGARELGMGPATAALRQHAFVIGLDPESGNGHTLFADSDVNGPRGRALIEELIPAIEARFPLIREPSARVLRGHSSGGWSTLWLALTYPETFGACWSSAPDPVSFEAFQSVNIYSDENFYQAGGVEHVSYRKNGKDLMTIRQESGGEHVLGPDFTSGQQWASWMAVFGPAASPGNPAKLFDPVTGAIDRAVAEKFAKYDITRLVKASPEKYAPLFARSVHLVVGDQDNFFLERGVAKLKAVTDTLARDKDATGYVKVVPGFDHGTIFGSAELRQFPLEILAHFRARGHAPAESPKPETPAPETKDVPKP
ncbi:MAG: alpha/beta hydrolase-fold protein [Planctomycetota bacterium]|nr:alpha/beta hydrolase-fold protein [Planctomycetota bacterium]